MTTFAKIALIFLSIIAVTGTAAGCASNPVSTPPAPTITNSPNNSLTPAAGSPTTSPASVPSISTSVKAAQISVKSNKASVVFPDKVTFSIEASCSNTIEDVSLQYGTDERSLVPSTMTSQPQFTADQDIKVSWDWEMKKLGSIPPGATIWWSWKLKDAEGKITSTPKQKLAYSDSRFSWSSQKYSDIDIYWHDQSDALINELLDAIQTRLSRIQLNVSIPADRKPKVYVYLSSDELRDAVLFENEWTGALAYPSYNIILTAVNSDELEWAKGALPHEVTHLLVGEAVFGPFGNIPTWLNEGLAEYSEGQMPDYMQAALDKACADNSLISIRSLAGNFPTDSSGANLAYAESGSIVKYLIEKYGWDPMRQLVAAFKDGATYDDALQKVYSLDINSLETQWKASIVAR